MAVLYFLHTALGQVFNIIIYTCITLANRMRIVYPGLAAGIVYRFYRLIHFGAGCEQAAEENYSYGYFIFHQKGV